jgi:hypothetical protein
MDLESLDRRVRNVETAGEQTAWQLRNFEPTVVTPPMLSFPSGGGSGGSVSWTPLAPATDFPITTAANGGMSDSLPRSPTNDSPWYLGKGAFDDGNVLGMGAGAIVVPTGLVRQGSEPQTAAFQNVLVIDPTNFNVVTTIVGPVTGGSSSSVSLPGECFFFAGYLWMLAAVATSGSSWGGSSYLFRYDTSTGTWTSSGGATPLNVAIAGGNLYFGGGATQLLAVDAANPTATPVVASTISNSRWLVGGPNAMWFYYGSSTNYWAYRADNLSSSTPVTSHVSLQSNINIIHHPCVDASGRMWAINTTGGLVRVLTNGTVTTYPDVVPTDPALGAPVRAISTTTVAFGGLSEMVQGPGDSFFFGAAIQADVVGGAAGMFRASIWQVSAAGSGTVWIDTEDAGLYETDGDLIGIPHVSGLTRQGNRLLFTVNCTTGNTSSTSSNSSADPALSKTRRIIQSLTIS